jgi:hypothetical protein
MPFLVLSNVKAAIAKPTPAQSINRPTACNIALMGNNIYLSFFLGRSCEVCPHFFLRQLVARGGRRA